MNVEASAFIGAVAGYLLAAYLITFHLKPSRLMAMSQHRASFLVVSIGMLITMPLALLAAAYLAATKSPVCGLATFWLIFSWVTGGNMAINIFRTRKRQ